MPSSRKSRNGQAAAIGAALTLAGLTYYLYQRLVPSPDDTSRNSTDGGESSKAGKKKYTPTLSLSLPTQFVRTRENMTLLEGLLSTLSQSYLVTLIAPPPRRSSSPSSSSLSGSGIDSVAALSHSLSHVPGFDARRVLEYSKEEGRLALARAVGCDAHCEVMLEFAKESNIDKDGQGKEQRMEETEEDDGSQTPRAAAPASSQSKGAEGDKIAMLEQYHADMARIRKSSSLLIFLLLPVLPLQWWKESETPVLSSVISELAIETVIQPFLLPGQEEFSSRVPGVKIVDGRNKAGGREQAWSQAATRVGALSKGWK